MADVFNRQIEFGDSFKSELMTINFSGVDAGLLVQNLDVTYNQTITRIWELGSQKTYYIAGRTAGTFNVAKIAGPSGASQSFLSQYGDVCNASSNTLSLRYDGGWCNGGGGQGFNMLNAVLESIRFQVAAADMVVNEQVAGMFSSMETS